MSSGNAGTAASQAVSGPRLSQAAIEWAASRKISAETLAALGVASGTVFFPGANAKLPALFYKYPEGWKARSFPEKHFVAGKGFKLDFWGIEEVLQGPLDQVFIVEGEMDRAALVEAGVPTNRVLSVPNGAKDRPADDPEDQRGYEYVKEALKSGLHKAKRFVWCGDGDGPGHALRADMVRILGAARFWFVDWPEGCKDANDYLVSDGPDALRELVCDGSLPWPVDGIYRLNELPEPPPLTLWSPGFPEWERKIMLAPRTLSVATGHPGHGKTMLWQQIWFNVVKEYGVTCCMASFETRPKPHIRRQLRTLISGKLERGLTPEETAKADKWINERYLFLAHAEQRPTLEWFLDMAEVAVVRHGARIIQVDPWNRLEDQKNRDESKTEYIGRCLKTLHAFAHDMNVHVQILAHPAKMDGNRRGLPPTLEDISDSKHWDNMVDQGFVVHRPSVFEDGQRKTEAELHHKKARFEELGYPCVMDIVYSLETGKYRSSDYDVGY